MTKEPDTELKAIINQVIEEADHHKQQLKHEKAKTRKDDPAFNGDQEEAVEGDVANDDPDVDPEGPIKEHLLGEVHKRRGQKRKERAFGNDQDNADVLHKFDAPTGAEQQMEAGLPDDNDGGPALAAFNMDEAEQEEAGLGGEKKGEEEEDAWLLSLQEQNQDPAKASTSAGAGTKEPVIDGTSSKVTEAVRAKHEQQQKILDSNEPLTDSEIAEARSLLLQHLLPREKVMQALARLSSERATNDSKIVRNLDALPYSSCSKAKQTLTATLLSTVRLVPAPFDKRKLGRHRSCEHSMADIMQKARDRVGSKRVKQSKPVIIDALTDAATSLMTEDADAFELTREEIAHALQISQVTVPQARPAAETAGGDGSDDEDMFADSDDEGTKKKPSDAAAAAKTTTAPENSSASHADAAAAPTADTGQGDAVAQPVEAPATGSRDNGEVLYGSVPLGFILDRASGYYMHPESGWYYHLESRCYYRSGTWYSGSSAPAETA